MKKIKKSKQPTMNRLVITVYTDSKKGKKIIELMAETFKAKANEELFFLGSTHMVTVTTESYPDEIAPF